MRQSSDRWLILMSNRGKLSGRALDYVGVRGGGHPQVYGFGMGWLTREDDICGHTNSYLE